MAVPHRCAAQLSNRVHMSCYHVHAITRFRLTPKLRPARQAAQGLPTPPVFRMDCPEASVSHCEPMEFYMCIRPALQRRSYALLHSATRPATTRAPPCAVNGSSKSSTGNSSRHAGRRSTQTPSIRSIWTCLFMPAGAAMHEFHALRNDYAAAKSCLVHSRGILRQPYGPRTGRAAGETSRCSLKPH